MFHRAEVSAGIPGSEPVMSQQGAYGREELPAEKLREEREYHTESAERVYRESEVSRTELESLRESLHTTAEIEHRREDIPEALSEEGFGSLQERVILERETRTEPGTTELRTTEEIRAGQPAETSVRRSEETGPIPSGQETTIIQEGGTERIKDRVTEKENSASEQTEIFNHTDRVGQYVTEQGEVLRTEHEKSQLVYREEESQEDHSETIYDRLRQQLTEERDRVIQKQDTETRITERSETDLEREVRTESTASQLVRETEKERQVPGPPLGSRVQGN